MAGKSKSELLARYEDMRRNHATHYFDTDDIEEIAYQYEIISRYEEALEAINVGLEIHINNPNLLTLRAKYLLLLGKDEEAALLIESVPSNTELATLVKAELLYTQGKLNDAYNLLTTYIQEERVDTDFCLDCMGLIFDYTEHAQLPDFVELAMKQLKDGSELLRELAMTYEEKQEFERAVETYNKLLDNDPYSLSEWINAAKCYALLKEYDKAIEACDFALTIKEKDENTLSIKGYCLYDKGDYLAAIEQFIEFGEVIEDKSIAYELIAECYIKLSMLPDAIVYLLDALELSPRNSNICYQLATCYYDMGNSEEAIKYLDNTLALDPSDTEALTLLGEVYYNSEQWEEARVALEKAVALDRDNKDLLRLIGNVKLQLGLFDEAIAHYEHGLTIDEYDVKLTFKRILAYYNKGDLQKAAELLQELDESTQQLDVMTELSTENREELVQTRVILDKLKDILRDSLDEEL